MNAVHVMTMAIAVNFDKPTLGTPGPVTGKIKKVLAFFFKINSSLKCLRFCLIEIPKLHTILALCATRINLMKMNDIK